MSTIIEITGIHPSTYPDHPEIRLAISTRAASSTKASSKKLAEDFHRRRSHNQSHWIPCRRIPTPIKDRPPVTRKWVSYFYARFALFKQEDNTGRGVRNLRPVFGSTMLCSPKELCLPMSKPKKRAAEAHISIGNDTRTALVEIAAYADGYEKSNGLGEEHDRETSRS